MTDNSDWTIDENGICVDCGRKIQESYHFCPWRFWGTKSYGGKPRW